MGDANDLKAYIEALTTTLKTLQFTVEANAKAIASLTPTARRPRAPRWAPASTTMTGHPGSRNWIFPAMTASSIH
jgi:hypothetical protein